MPDPQIDALIDKVDNSETIRDEIAAILALESENQEALARDASKDPGLWTLRVFIERANPFNEWIEAPEQEDVDASPIVNVRFDNSSVDLRSSNLVERQKHTGVFHVDCFGYGIATEDPVGTGHVPGDEKAAREVQRAVRLVRNIIMAGTYTYLGSGLRGIVARRWFENITALQAQIDGRAFPQIQAARMALHVEFNEFSPQVTGEAIELISVTAKRSSTGQIFFTGDWETYV